MLTGVRGGRSPVHPNDAVNMGQSSNDVIPTAIHVAALERIQKHLIPALVHLRDRLAERARAFDAVVKIGRTHLQDAVPIRLGQEFSGYAARSTTASAGSSSASHRSPSCPSAARPLGTGINTHAEVRRADGRTRWAGDRACRFGRRPSTLRGHGPARRGRRGLRRTEDGGGQPVLHRQQHPPAGLRPPVRDRRDPDPELQPGSSIMPGKVNPVIPEAVMMVAAQVVGNDATITWANALGSNFDLNVMMPVIAYNLLQSIDLLTAAADHLAAKCVDAGRFLAGQKAQGAVRIEADPDRCRQLIEKSLAMCTALAPRIGYDNASAIAKAAYREGKTIREVAL